MPSFLLQGLGLVGARQHHLCSALFACVSVYQLKRVVSKITSGNKGGYCNSGGTSAPYSLDDECFRLGAAWPLAHLLLAAAILAAGCFPTSSEESESTNGWDFSRIKDLPSIKIFDNRLHAGGVVLLLSAINLLIPVLALRVPADDSTSSHHATYWRSFLLFWSAAVYALARRFGRLYMSQNRLRYAGLFGLPLTMFIALQVALCTMPELVFLLFSDEPIWGREATAHSNCIVAATAVGCAAVTALLFVHKRAFILPTNTSVRASMAAAKIESIDPTIDVADYTTPLNSTRTHKTPLVMSPEDSTSIFDFLTFSWINPILSISQKNEIDCGDLYHLGIKDMPYTYWHVYSGYRKQGRGLFLSLILSFYPQLLAEQCMAIMSGVLSFGSPFFMQMILKSIQDYHNKEDSSGPSNSSEKRKLILYAFGLVASVCSESMTSSHRRWYSDKVYMKIYSMLVADMTSRVINRRGHIAKDEDSDDGSKKTGSNIESDGKVMTILTADIRRIIYLLSTIITTVEAPVNICIGVWYLYQLLGISAIVGLFMSAMQYPIHRFLVKYTYDYQTRLSLINDERITLITEMFKGIKGIKLFGWQSRFAERVRIKREEQLEANWSQRVTQICMTFLTNIISSLTLVAILAVHSCVFGHKLTADVIFTTIALFGIVNPTINMLQTVVGSIVSGFISIARIESFMAQGQIQPIEDRVALDSNAGVVGFENASFEWSISSSTNRLSLSPTNTSTSTLALPTEQTPLLFEPACADSSSPTPVSDACDMTKPDKQPEFSLKDITLRFPVGGFSIIAGPTGSGKSSLLSALVGEMHLTSGRILIPTANGKDVDAHNADKRYREIAELSNWGLVATDIAYVSQEAWLRNATIRDNILFGEPYIQERYEEVLRVCALKPDFRIFKAGDMTEVGERGITLSGGQKQRVALARAVYSSRRILLIDDCLSAVDAHTGKHILHSCLLGQTDLMRGRTRILVTHHTAACLPYSDYVVMLQNGRVAFSGTPDQMQPSNLSSSETSETAMPESTAENGKKIDALSEDPAANRLDNWTDSVSDPQPEDEYTFKRHMAIREQLCEDSGMVLSASDEGQIIEDEEREFGYVQPETWLSYINKCGSYRMWLALSVVSMIPRVFSMSQTYWISLWTGSASDKSGSQHSAFYWLGIYVLIQLVSSATSMGVPLLPAVYGLKASRSIHEDLLSKVLNAKPAFFDTTPIGRIVSRFTSDIGSIDLPIMSLLSSVLSDMINVSSIVFVISYNTPAFIVPCIVVSLVYFSQGSRFLNSTREIKRLRATSMSPLYSLFSEIIAGTVSIRAFGAQNLYIKEVIYKVYMTNVIEYFSSAPQNWWYLKTQCLGSIMTFLAVVFVLLKIDDFNAGMAGFILTYAISFTNNLGFCVNFFSNCEMRMNAVERINQYLNIEQEASLESTPENKPPASWPATGNIEIDDLVVEYVPGAPVLHGISLSVKHGEKIGIVGRTGAGKSTLSLAFLRYVEASRGRVVLDNVDISAIGLEDLRRNVTIIPQDPTLFNGTIRFNLDPFEEYSDGLLWDALKRAHLVRENDSQATSSTASVYEGRSNTGENALERMSGIFSGLDAEIKENGQNLSLGQRQLVAIARALVRRSRLIIMDEATASVDFDTDDRIQQTIRGPEFSNSTLLCVAHRLRTIIDYDRVLVLDKGKIAEFDTPWNLLQKDEKDSIFKSMCLTSGEYDYLVGVAKKQRQR